MSSAGRVWPRSALQPGFILMAFRAPAIHEENPSRRSIDRCRAAVASVTIRETSRHLLTSSLPKQVTIVGAVIEPAIGAAENR
jgi:hypothetical protein